VGGEQAVLVAGVPDQELDVSGGATGERGPRRRDKDVTVDNGRERRRGVRHSAHESRRCRRLPVTVRLRRDEVVRGDLGEVGHAGNPAESTADLRRNLGREVGREVRLRNALQDRATKGSGRGGHRQQRGHRAGPGGLAEHGDVARIAADAGHVALHPLQRGETGKCRCPEAYS